MSRKLTASDRKSLIHLASSLPKGDKKRRAILSSLNKKTAAGNTTVEMKLVFDHSPEELVEMWNEYADREGEDPADDIGDLDPKDVVFMAISGELPWGTKLKMSGSIR